MSTKQYVVRQARNQFRGTRTRPCQSEKLEARRLLAVHIWSGAVSGNWSDAGNWSGGAPQAGESDIVLEFPANAVRTTAVNDIGELTVSRLVIGQGSYTLRGEAINLAGNIEAALEAGTHRVENPLRLIGDTRIDVSGASSTDNRSLILAGVISGGGGIVKYGHNVRLAADNTFAGSVVLEGGRIGIDGNQPQTNVIIQSGVLSGTGRVGNVTFGDQYGSLGDTIQPSLGLLFDGLPEITGNLALSGSTYFRPNLGHPGGTLNVVGAVALNDAILAGAYENAPPVGSTFTLINNAGSDPVVGAFSGIPEGGVTRILDKDVKITYVGGDGNDVVGTVQGQTIRTRMELTPSASVVLPGQGVTLNVTVSTAFPTGVTPGGTVQLFQDDAPIATAALDAAGKASFDVMTLPLRGSSRFHVTYPGDAARDLEPVRSEDVRVRVILSGQTETQLYMDPTSGYYGSPSLILAKVNGLGIPEGQPTGTVDFYINGELAGSAPVDAEGRASIQSSAFPIGNSVVRAVYSGDGTFTTSAIEGWRYTRLIDGRYYPTSTTLTQSSARSAQGQPLTLTATVARAPGELTIPYAGFATFLANGQEIGTAAVNTNGVAQLAVESLAVGEHELTVTYSGDEVYYTSQGGPLVHTVTFMPQLQALADGAALAAVADIDGDGHGDLVWRDEATGANSVQFLDAQARVKRTVDLLAMTDMRWKLESAGDFNGDGKGELVWRNSETGRVLMWKVFNDKVGGIQQVLGAQVQDGWRIVGTGDFNGDGQADLAWRNDNNGKAVVWAMRGHGVLGVTGLGPVARNLQWSIETVGDANGDGKPDLIWRNQSTGANAAWLMNGTNFTAFVPLGRLTGEGWTIPGSADFGNDGSQELLFRNTASGELRTWAIDPAAMGA